MKKIIIILVTITFAMEGLGWWVYKLSKKEDSKLELGDTKTQASIQEKLPSDEKFNYEENKDLDTDSVQDSIAPIDVASFPPPVVETVNGETQRTIHMGVRKWSFDPYQITANYGEKVILIIHNADVIHSISIPDLNVKSEVSEEGAIVEFTASKSGTFSFSCDVLGHKKMEGRIMIKE